MKSSKNKIKIFKLVRFCISIICLISVAGSVNFASASTLQQKKDAAIAAQKAAKAAADQKAAEASAIQSQINKIQESINKTNAAINNTIGQISDTENTIADLNNQIITQETNLAAEQDKQNKVVAAWYMEGDNSGLFNAMINSNSLSEMVTKEEYYDAIRRQIELAMENINKIKADLADKKMASESKKAELVKLQQEQTAYRSVVLAQKSQQNSLLNSTVAQKKDYLALVEDLQSQISQISAQIYAQRRSSNTGTPGALGYPYGQPPGVYVLDPWNFYQAECVSYAAWYWNVKLGKEWYNTQPGRGSAKYWPEIAHTLGYSVSQTPKVGAIISWYGPLYASDKWGHVAIVESVNADGTIDVSEYNYAYEHGGGTRSHINPADDGSYSYIY